jgi:ABC-type multidrug transport system fused ATPase/permease subunit
VKRFILLNEFKLDYNNRAYLAIVTANRWLSVRLEFVSTGILVVSGMLVIMERNFISPSTAGLLLSYVLGFTTWLAWFVRVTADVEQQMNSIERVVHYTRLEQEAPFDIRRQSSLPWPSRGEIIFDQVTLKYRAGLDQNALSNVSFKIRSQEKIGVAGRTGAGKSSLLVALFRLVELYSGKVIIDGEDISQLGLTTLRSGLVIIPQDPVLFTGDIRTNLDPFSQHSDVEIWGALEMVQMKNFIQSLPEQLAHQVSATGGFSVGQRQLLSFARALLGEVKILLLDEATASCDMETDHLIQKTLREKFADCTVITIAHRLNTIMDADRILVMDSGAVAEFDEPFKLLSDNSSYLSRMVQETGDAADHLRAIAEQKHMQGSRYMPAL